MRCTSAVLPMPNQLKLLVPCALLAISCACQPSAISRRVLPPVEPAEAFVAVFAEVAAGAGSTSVHALFA